MGQSDQLSEGAKRLLVAARNNPRVWVDLFRQELPDYEILEELPEPSAAPVPFVVVGRPPAGLLARVPGLEVVLSLNAGIEHLLASGEVPEHIPIVRLVDSGLKEGMRDWVMAHALAWHRHVLLYRAQQSETVWRPQPEKLASERIVTILGAGELGGTVAEAFLHFGFNTRTWSRSHRKIGAAAAFGGNELMPAVEGAHLLVNLLPLTAETANLLNASVFDLLAPGAFLINGGRGGHIVEDDLIAALDRGQLSGAALDVFRAEPLDPTHAFWHHPKILVSPHVAAPTHPQTAVAEMAQNVRRFERGEPMYHVVDRRRGY